LVLDALHSSRGSLSLAGLETPFNAMLLGRRFALNPVLGVFSPVF
jgi:hypothetical protein